MRKLALAGVALLCMGVAGCNRAEVKDAHNAELAKVADWVAILNLQERYYANFSGLNAAGFSQFYTDDAVFEVNGAVYKGRDAIEGLYASLRKLRTSGKLPTTAQGFSHTLLTNPIIDIHGDTATASYIWTGVANPPDPTKSPVVDEQGRDYDLYVKKDGKWLIKKRTVIADGAVPKSMMNTWKRMPDYDITKE